MVPVRRSVCCRYSPPSHVLVPLGLALTLSSPSFALAPTGQGHQAVQGHQHRRGRRRPRHVGGFGLRRVRAPQAVPQDPPLHRLRDPLEESVPPFAMSSSHPCPALHSVPCRCIDWWPRRALVLTWPDAFSQSSGSVRPTRTRPTRATTVPRPSVPASVTASASTRPSRLPPPRSSKETCPPPVSTSLSFRPIPPNSSSPTRDANEIENSYPSGFIAHGIRYLGQAGSRLPSL